MTTNEIILGIDPGSRTTGYGVVAMHGSKLHYLGSGCINAGRGKLSDRLLTIFTGVETLIRTVARQFHLRTLTIN